MVNVAILGYGVVGSGVAEVLTENNSQIDRKAEEDIRLKYILDVRDFPDSPYQTSLSMILPSLRTTRRSTSWWRPSAAPGSPRSSPSGR